MVNRTFTSIILFALALVFLSGCGNPRTNGAALESSGGPVAFRVGSTTVTVADFSKKLEEFRPGIEQYLAQAQTPEERAQRLNEVRTTVFDNMVQEELLLHLARQQGVGVDPKQVDAAVGEAPPPEPGATGAASGFRDTTQQRVAATRNILVTTMVARNTRADMFKSRHILVNDEATADKVIADLGSGKAFADLARELSNDPGSKEQGGELGWVARGNFVPEFEQAAFSAELNTPVKVQSQFGWHVIVVEDRQNQRPFDSIDDLRGAQNAQELYETTFLPWYDQYRKDAQASKEFEITPGFDPNQVPLPFG
ncbi:MAG: peptidylprolyl isomerase [Chloroflexaceae bacterium]|jgi:peptidyl-prolyl cis-trans isomerase C|nr:peptidylprolyl isomerase [Chloroflexaceae bacterium]